MWIAGDFLSPILLFSKTNHGVAEILQTLRILLVAPVPLSIVVVVPIDVDRCLVILIIEIGTGPTGLDQVLRV